MNIFIEELIDSKKNAIPPNTITKFLNSPSIEKPGTAIINMQIIHIGMKQHIKIVEIITTILATFLLALVSLAASPDVADIFLHCACCFSTTTSFAVHTVITTKAENGTKTKLIG